MRDRPPFVAVILPVTVLLCAALAPGAAVPPAAGQARNPGTLQSAEAPTAVIAGQVVDADSGRPVPQATVLLMGRPARGTGPARGALGRGQPGAPTPTNDSVLVNGDGWFVFSGLPAGSYTLTVQAEGYLVGRSGQRRLNGPAKPIPLTDRQVITDTAIRLWKMATITGTVVDEAGEPAVETAVRALRVMTRGARRQIVPAGMTRTDDRGDYRIARLTPGDYVVCVPESMQNVPLSFVAASQAAAASGRIAEFDQQLLESGAPIGSTFGRVIGDQALTQSSALGSGLALPDVNGPLLTYPSTFYPSATILAEAQRITLASGQERAGVNLQLQPVPTVRVSGTVTLPDGPAVNVGVHLVPAGEVDLSPSNSYDTATTVTDSTGSFVFLGVPVGQYTARASIVPRPDRGGFTTVVISAGSGGIVSMGSSVSNTPATPTRPVLWGEAPVSVGDAGLDGVAIALREGARLSGRVVFAGDGASPTGRALQAIGVAASPVDGRPLPSMTPGRVNADAQFTTMGYPPGTYFLSVSGGVPGWTLQSVTLGGRNVDGEPIDLGTEDQAGIVVTFGKQPTRINGTVRGTTGSVPADAMVFLFPADYTGWIDQGMSPRRMRSATARTDGGYTLTGVPAGQYLLAAVPTDDVTDEQDATFFEALSRIATHVSLDPGSTTSLDLTIGHIR
jgi:Carboxypeptidase regulatory-like domain